MRFRHTATFLLVLFVLNLPMLAEEDRKLTHRAAPSYPELAKRMHVTGTVPVEVELDAAGHVVAAKATGGPSMLTPAAVDAARHCQWESGATGKATIVFNFQL